MALTQAVLDNIANAAIDYHMDRGKVFYQHLQTKPLLKALRAKQKTFPGGKGEITTRPVFETQSSIEGFNSDDTLTFVNPTPIKEASYPWKMIHTGIFMTTDELLRDGISVVDTNGRNTKNASQRELTALANILEVKLEDMSEGYAQGMNAMLWGDGTQDAKEVPGVSHMVAANPTAGIVGGIDRATVTMWRNRARTAAHQAATTSAADGVITSNPDTSALIKVLRSEARQLRRYGNPSHKILCGSQFLEALEAEVDAKGIYTQSGFADSTDIGMGKITLRGIGTFEYDPTLDDLSLPKRCYVIDTANIKLMPIEGEDMKRHYPARPHDKMVIYRSMTWAGGLVGRQLNTSGVYDIA
jgi:hypothetical protein